VRAVEQRRQPIAGLDRVVQHAHAISPSLEGRWYSMTGEEATDSEDDSAFVVCPFSLRNFGLTKDRK
jgi:hypothetical protein